MTRRANVDEINTIVNLINSGHSPSYICKQLKCSPQALMRRISRNANYLISKLNSAKYTTLKLFIDKNRSTTSIALSLDLPETLINCAKKLVRDNEYPSPLPQSNRSSK